MDAHFEHVFCPLAGPAIFEEKDVVLRNVRRVIQTGGGEIHYFAFHACFLMVNNPGIRMALKICVICNRISRHSENKTHLTKVHLGDIGKVNIATQLSIAYRLSIEKYNVQSKIIYCIRFCGAFELALRGNDESDTDISDTAHTVLVLRYEFGGKVCKRFWGFLNPKGQDAEAISKCIIREVRPLIGDNTEKVIAQSFDGAAVMIREVFSNARFTHCYAHQLNLIVSKCASQNKAARVFFSCLEGISTFFFSNSSKRLTVLEETVARQILKVSHTRWNFKSRVVKMVYEKREALIECFEILEEDQSSETVQKACGLHLMLQDREFNFWL
ncbi:hypothetical protein PR048_015927 [Dryococelus australis]|uniref:DUF4371 domain-containing protein n=1 Tax=Dryococelus australis TaxID=614101 RepID=A0ABQ9HIA2_9NEOP|nr:hypothetical protein PR048_015927 [Dryococelus australis]